MGVTAEVLQVRMAGRGVLYSYDMTPAEQSAARRLVAAGEWTAEHGVGQRARGLRYYVEYRPAPRGSYVEQRRLPAAGTPVWALAGQVDGTPVRGRLERTSDIDGQGLGNTYCDVLLDDGRRVHVPLAAVYPRRPRRVTRSDRFGAFVTWE